MKIAIASDLHIGDAACAQDLRIAPKPTKKRKAGSERSAQPFMERFSQFVRDTGIRADFLVIPGDITNRGAPEEFDLAARIVGSIADSIGVGADKIIFIPGNHDVDWTVLTGGNQHPLRVEQRYAPFSRFGGFLKADPKPLTKPPYFSVQNWDQLFVVGYNSAWHDGPDSPEVHHGRVDPSHMNEIATYLKRTPPASDAIRMFVVHHHPFQYMDALKEWDDFSIMQNAEALFDVLNEFKFDLLVHGHKHYPNFNTQILNAGHPVAILGAGSFCRVLDTRWNGIVANQFHVIETMGRDAQTGAVRGTVKNWAYLTAGGWNESYQTGESEKIRRRGTGIQHEKSFGFYCSPPELLSIIRRIVTGDLRNQQLLTISQLIDVEPNLRFAPSEAFERALREFTDASTYDLIGSGGERYLIQATS